VTDYEELSEWNISVCSRPSSMVLCLVYSRLDYR
jgi:predicted SpoU family rRNA methylase